MQAIAWLAHSSQRAGRSWHRTVVRSMVILCRRATGLRAGGDAPVRAFPAANGAHSLEVSPSGTESCVYDGYLQHQVRNLGATREIRTRRGSVGVRRVLVVTDPGTRAAAEPVVRWCSRGCGSCGGRCRAIRSGRGRAHGLVVSGGDRLCGRAGGFRTVTWRSAAVRPSIQAKAANLYATYPAQLLDRVMPSRWGKGIPVPGKLEAAHREGAHHGGDGKRDNRRGDL